jgi:hypothetical protein
MQSDLFEPVRRKLRLMLNFLDELFLDSRDILVPASG